MVAIDRAPERATPTVQYTDRMPRLLQRPRLLLLLVVLCAVCQVAPADSPDKAALMNLRKVLLTQASSDPAAYKALEKRLMYWQDKTDPCDPVNGPWPWLGCNDTRVVQLNLTAMGLTGAIPEQISQLDQLQSLALSDNEFLGPVPHFLTSLLRLQDLRLDLNQLANTLPDFLSTMASLTTLQLSGNQLQLSIPASLTALTGLSSLDLSANYFTGQLPDLSPMTSLTMLNLAANELQGPIPSWLGLLPRLQVLGLRSNSFQGSLPDISGATALRRLFLGNTGISGPIPTNLGLLTNLEILYASQNQLTGGIPNTFGNLQALRQLDLSGNSNLGGSLPIDLGTLEQLNLLALSGCGVYGTLPRVYSELTNLQGLYLDSNALTGTIPSAFSQLTKLSQLYLSQNQIEGSLPTELCQLTKLINLELSANNLNGTLDMCFVDLPMLASLGIADNQFSGPLPLPLDSSDLKFSYAHNCFFSAPDQNACALVQQIASGSLPLPVIVVLAVVGAALILVVLVSLCVCRRKRKGSDWGSLHLDSAGPVPRSSSTFSMGLSTGDPLKHILRSVREFGISQMEDATRNFTAVYGRCAFGTVYMAMGLPDLTPMQSRTSYRALAKRASTRVARQLTEQGFKEKVALIALARHRYIVRLLGFCVTPRERILVYEFLPKGTVYRRLHSHEEQPLSWPARVKVAATLACALEHLHCVMEPPITHGAVSSANVLIAPDGSAKLSDLALGSPGWSVPESVSDEGTATTSMTPASPSFNASSKGIPSRSVTEVSTLSVLPGNSSPMVDVDLSVPPGLDSSGVFSPRVVPTAMMRPAGSLGTPSPEQKDVYDFGVVLLELISGQEVEHQGNHITEFAKPFLDNPSIVQLMVDPQVGSAYNTSELLVLASLARNCIQDAFSQRPTMRDVRRRMEEQMFLEQGIFDPADMDDVALTANTVHPGPASAGFMRMSSRAILTSPGHNRGSFHAMHGIEMPPIYEPGSAPTALGIRAHGQRTTLETLGSAMSSAFGSIGTLFQGQPSTPLSRLRV